MPTTEAKLFGTRRHIPTDIITISNVVVSFPSIPGGEQAALCAQITMSIQRRYSRAIDLVSGDAIGIALIPDGIIEMTGVVLPSKDPIALINTYSSMCSPGGNLVKIYFHSECNDSVLEATAEGCILMAFVVQAGQNGTGYNAVFHFAGMTIKKTT